MKGLNPLPTSLLHVNSISHGCFPLKNLPSLHYMHLSAVSGQRRIYKQQDKRDMHEPEIFEKIYCK